MSRAGDALAKSRAGIITTSNAEGGHADRHNRLKSQLRITRRPLHTPRRLDVTETGLRWLLEWFLHAGRLAAHQQGQQKLRITRADPPFWSASVPSVSARCSGQNGPIGRTPVDAPAGRTVRVCSVRLVSFTHRPVAAICYEVEPVDGPARSTVQSELTANKQLPPGRRGSPAGRGARGPAARRVPRRHRNGRGAGAQDQAKRAAGRRRDRSPRRLPGPGAG